MGGVKKGQLCCIVHPNIVSEAKQHLISKGFQIVSSGPRLYKSGRVDLSQIVIVLERIPQENERKLLVDEEGG